MRVTQAQKANINGPFSQMHNYANKTNDDVKAYVVTGEFIIKCIAEILINVYVYKKFKQHETKTVITWKPENQWSSNRSPDIWTWYQHNKQY